MTRERLYRWLVPRVVAPLAERFGLPVWTTVRRLTESQWRSPEEFEDRALARLQPLLDQAVRHVPHYRRLFADAGLDPRDIKSVADLARVPISTKRELRAGFPGLTTAENLPASRRQPMMTSGSTGLPFEFYWDRAVLPVLGGTERFWLAWWGIAVWHTRIVIASPTYFYERIKPPRRLHALANRVVVGERAENLPADQITPAQFRALVARVTSRGPYYIRSYPGSLASLAAGLVKDGVPLASYPSAVVALAETLTPANAASLRAVFRCPVANHYSAWEVPQIAHSCPDNPTVLHVNAERVIVRVVRPDGADAALGEMGRVVVTDLANDVMPFINYSAGDLAVAGERCPCGRGMPTLARLEGRESEMIRTPEGREISSGALGQLLTFVIGIIPYVWEYQAVQTAPGAVTLRVVPTTQFTLRFQASLARGVEDFLGPDMTVTVEPVDAIPLEPSGKRMIIKPLPVA
jgi:phenylacetate-CoA ligase